MGRPIYARRRFVMTMSGLDRVQNACKIETMMMMMMMSSDLSVSARCCSWPDCGIREVMRYDDGRLDNFSSGSFI